MVFYPDNLGPVTHQLNLQPRVLRPEASSTSLGTGSPGVGSAFRIWGCFALVRDTSADKLSARAIPSVFLGFPVDSPDYAFYHPPLHQFLDSREVRFDESVSYYARYPCRGLPVPPPPLFLTPSPPPAPSLPRTLSSSCSLSSSHPLLLLIPLLRYPRPPLVLPRQSPQRPSALPRQVTVDSGGVGAGGANTSGARSGGACSRGAGAGGASLGGARAGGAGTGGASSGGASGAGTGGANSGGAGVGGAGTGGASSGGAGAGDTYTGGATSGDTGSGGASFEETGAGYTTSAVPAQPPTGTTRVSRHPANVRVRSRSSWRGRGSSGLRALGLPSSSPARSQSPPAFGPTFPPPDDSSAVWSSPRSPSPPLVVPHYRVRPCPLRAYPLSPVTDLHTALLSSSLHRSSPESVLPSPPPSSLPVSPTPISDYYRAARPIVSRVLATLATDSRFSPSSVSALTAAVAEFAATSRLDFTMHVVPAQTSRPLSVGGEFALGCDGDPGALDIPTPCTYREAVPGEWLFKVKRPPGSPPVFKAHYVARCFNQREGVDFFQTFAPTTKMKTLQGLLHVAAQRDYELHSLDFSTAFLQGRLHEEIWLRRPPGFTDTFPPGTQLCPSSADLSLFVRAGSTPFFILVYINDLVFATADRAALAQMKSELQKRHTCTDLGEMQRYLGLQITRDRAARTITQTQSHMVLRRFEFQFSTTQATPLAVDHRLTGPFPDEPFESSGPYAELVGCLMYLMTLPGGTQPVELTGHCDSSYTDDVETQRSNQGCCFSLGAGAVTWRSTRSTSVALSSAEAEIDAGAMAAQELRWLTFLLTELGERPRSAPTLYADNKAMILLCREPQLESRVKHIDARYFLLRELHRRDQARLDFVASEANAVDVFTKALAPGDHHRFCVQLGLAEQPARCPLQPVALPFAARAPPLQPASHPCSPRAAPAARSSPLQPASRPCSPRAGPAARAPPLAARAPPLQPAQRPCSPRVAPAARVPPPEARAPPLQPASCPCSPLAAHLRPARRPCSPLPAPAALLAPLAALLAPMSTVLALPCCAQPYWPAPSCPSRPAAARPAVRRPSGRPSRAQPCPALRTSLVLARRCLRAALLVACHPALPAMASLCILTFDYEGRSIQFDTCLDDLQL
ncbi:unnamed protein product [Closterium sp. NIES-53]